MFVNELMNECVVFVNVGPEGTVGRMNERTQWVSRIFIREFVNLGRAANIAPCMQCQAAQQGRAVKLTC